VEVYRPDRQKYFSELDHIQKKNREKPRKVECEGRSLKQGRELFLAPWRSTPFNVRGNHYRHNVGTRGRDKDSAVERGIKDS